MVIERENKNVLYTVKFYVLVTLQIPAIIVTILIFTFFLTHRTALKKLQNHAILLLIMVSFIQLVIGVPMALHFYRIGYVDPTTSAYCTWWTFFENTFLLINELIVATMSIHRHVFIFHADLFHNKFKRFVYHHLPLAFCFIYSIGFYCIVILLYSCDGTQWDFSLNICGFNNCYVIYSKVLSVFDWLGNNGVSAGVIIAANLSLILRVIMYKRHRHRNISWKKQRRMTLQLLAISTLYLIGCLPSTIMEIIRQLYSDQLSTAIKEDYTLDLVYVICLLSPWIYLGLLPELSKWIRNHLRRGQILRNNIRPAINN